VTEDEIEVVAAELAKAGGVSWHCGHERGPLKLVLDRYRDRARLAIAALDRVRAAKHNISPARLPGEPPGPSVRVSVELISGEGVSEGSLVLYHPPGDQRTYSCRVQKIQGSRIYLVPELPTCTGWVDLDNLSTPAIQ
jgi:hypothetical protein